MKLQPMTEFVDKQYNNELDYTTCFLNCVHYADFLRQPLTLGMFVPVGENGNVISDKYDSRVDDPNKNFHQLINEYNGAKEKVLFEGFEVRSYIDDEENMIEYVGALFRRVNKGKWIPDNTLTIERLADQEVYLTPSALKQIGL